MHNLPISNADRVDGCLVWLCFGGSLRDSSLRPGTCDRSRDTRSGRRRKPGPEIQPGSAGNRRSLAAGNKTPTPVRWGMYLPKIQFPRPPLGRCCRSCGIWTAPDSRRLWLGQTGSRWQCTGPVSLFIRPSRHEWYNRGGKGHAAAEAAVRRSLRKQRVRRQQFKSS